VVKNNRTNEDALRQGLTEKARLTAQEVPREKLEEAEREDRKNIHESRHESEEQ
jgi:hypothetical protein